MKNFLAKVKTWPVMKEVIKVTYKDVVRRGLLTPFLVFIAFLISFTTQRLAALLLPSVNIIIRQYHIHHFYFGLILLIISNWISLSSNREGLKHTAAVLFGIGLGIVADEVGLLLTCTSPLKLACDYHARITWDFFVSMVGIFMSVLYFVPIWLKFRSIAMEIMMFLWTKIMR